MNHQILYGTLDAMSHQRNNEAPKRHSYEATVYILNEVFAEIVNEQNGETIFLNGVLTIVEKAYGVFLEWKVCDEPAEDQPDNTWVVEGGTFSSTNERPRSNLAHLFSADVKEIGSYKYIEKKGEPNRIQFFYKDGQSSFVFHLRGGGYEHFVNHLQRYSRLTRSMKEKNLVLLKEERVDALEKSVGMLNMNKDILSRFITHPYATSMTAFSKVTQFVTPLFDPDTVNEQQIREMRRREPTVEEANRSFRSHNEAGGFEHVFFHVDLPQRPRIQGGDLPVDETIWQRFRASNGRVVDAHGFKSLIFRGGIARSVRPIIWKYMLNYYKWDSTDEENKKLRKNKEEEYYRMKLQWMSISEDQQRRFSDFRDRKALIDKDVARTDRSHPFFNRSKPANLQLLKDLLMTYCMYDFDLGYVQGMSDFLSPLIVVLENEVDAFWCFAGLMERVHKNFEMDQLDIRKQLSNLKSLIEVVNPRLANYLESHDSEHMYFCFRWILVCFKREFSFDQIMYLWEVLWTEIPCKNFLLLFCVAILDGQTNMIIENKFGLTEILKHVNSLSMKIDLEKTIRSAEAIYHQLAAVQDKLPQHVCEILSFSVDEEANNNINHKDDNDKLSDLIAPTATDNSSSSLVSKIAEDVEQLNL